MKIDVRMQDLVSIRFNLREEKQMKFWQHSKVILRNVLVASTLAFATTSVFAHVKLVSATPAANATLPSQPNKLTLTFGGEVMLMHIKLLDAQGKDVALNYQMNHDLKKTFDIALPKLKAGKYTVGWIIMSKDGHHMNGKYSCTIQAAK